MCKKQGFVVLLGMLFTLCTAPASANVDVYDAGDRYLGVLMFQTPRNDLAIFVPSLERMAIISPATGDIAYRPGISYESADCSGQALCITAYMYQIYSSGQSPCTGESQQPVLHTIASRMTESGCQQDNDTGYYVTARVMAEAELPFTVPVALPLRFEVSQAVQQSAVPAVSVEGLIILAAALMGIGVWVLVRRR